MYTPEQIAAMYAEYDRLNESNPVLAARFALNNQLFEHPRPAPSSPATDTTGEYDHRDGVARARAIQASGGTRTHDEEAALVREALSWTRR